VNVQVNSCTGPPQSKAPAGICIVFWPCTAGEVLKWKVICVLPPLKENELAGMLFTIKSLALTVAGFTPPLTSTMKSVGGTKTVLPQAELLTEQPVGVGVGVGALGWAQYLPPVSE
jgi:hypothetical protein